MDTSELSEKVTPSLLNYTNGALPPGVSILTVIPASSYSLFRSGSSVLAIKFSLDVAGITTLIDAPDGVTIMSDRRFCGVPDRIETDLQIEIYGPPSGRWLVRNLTYSVDSTNAQGLSDDDIKEVIDEAFSQ
ncbi:hypothetical protein [Streptomyces bobili]|uniref:DUF4367 domain-containing protein n=1 Tax=Streptomyces bobili TaxID=67280 RepID=A0ABZ1R3J4_9ACTN|nr:hypothetical protein [Streptomyces bobili]